MKALPIHFFHSFLGIEKKKHLGELKKSAHPGNLIKNLEKELQEKVLLKF